MSTILRNLNSKTNWPIASVNSFAMHRTEQKSGHKRIYLASPTTYMEEMDFIKQAFDTNWLANAGRNVDEFEADLAKYIGIKHVVAMVSGTSAIHLALRLVGVGDGDTVFCSSLTFVATVNPVLYERAVPVLIDSERETWNMDPDALEYAFEHFQKPKAVLMVHLFGTPAKIDEIAAVCSKYDVPLIEESAESLGSTYKGIQTGNFGSCGILSFNGNKMITSSGGGALLTNSLEMSEKAKFLATQAREDKPYYEHCELGYNYRLSNVSAGIGRGQMLHLEEHLATKRRLYETYKEGLKGLPLSMNPFMDYSMPNHWLSCILLDEGCGITPEQLRLALERHNIEARRIWKPMHLQPLYKDYVYASIHEDVCKDIFERGLCLPSDIKMTAEEQMQIINVIRTTIEGDSGVSEVL